MKKYSVILRNAKTGEEKELAVLSAKSITEARKTACRAYWGTYDPCCEQLVVRGRK